MHFHLNIYSRDASVSTKDSTFSVFAKV